VKIVSYTNTSGEEDVSLAPSPARVCMHVLGIARTDGRVMREATALAEAGFDVSIVDVEPEHTRPTEEDIQSVCLKHIVNPGWFIRTRFKLWFPVKFALMVIRGTVRLSQAHADIYHAHDMTALPACYIAARLRRKPFIFDAHDLPLTDPEHTRWRRLAALAERLLIAMLAHGARVITPSPFYAQEIRTRYHVPQVTLVRNVPVYRAVPKTDLLRQYLGLGPEVRIALYQGYLMPDRALDRLVRAALFLEPNIVIVMMGAGKGDTPSQLAALIAAEGVADRVKILPPVPYEELLDWTASADIGLTVLPPDYSVSIRLTLPNKLFEYLMAGLPVLSTQLDAIAEVIRTYDVGQIVSSVAPADIGAAINAMLDDHEALVRMRRNALEVAEREFCWEKESQELVRFYRTILIQ
jgi:glycosyltransferase involved in cell wall biosynthesis